MVVPTGRKKSKKKKFRSDAIFTGTYAPQDQANTQFQDSASCHNFPPYSKPLLSGTQ